MQWISVEDRLPEPDENVLGYDDYYGGIDTAQLASWNPKRLVWLHGNDDCNITHWMPLPEPPEGAE